jgi:hypothetical protein
MKVRISFEFFDDNGTPINGVKHKDTDPDSKDNEIRMAILFPHRIGCRQWN